MKSKSSLLRSAFTCWALVFSNTALSQGTAFTYQGLLGAGGAPANGSYDFQFAIYSASSGGTQAGPTLTNRAVAVSNGLFMVTLDFGAGIFTGDSNWLDIAVRTNSGTFMELTPRQPLTPSPYSIFATTAGNVSGVIANANLPASPTFSGTVTAGALAGNGANVTNVNAAMLNGSPSGSFWQTGGNNIGSSQFLGSTDNEPLRFRVNNQRSLIILTNPADSASLVGGSPANQIDNGVEGSVIAGGGTTNFSGVPSSNHISADFSGVGSGSGNWIQSQADHSFIGGGLDNIIGIGAFSSGANFSVIGGGEDNTNIAYYGVIGGGTGNNGTGTYGTTVAGGRYNTAGGTFYGFATVGGGGGNTASGDFSVIDGGGYLESYLGNTASGNWASILGGEYNNATGDHTVIGGGYGNLATNSYATVPGGSNNVAGGLFSFAAGQQAQALHEGAFVWADSQSATFASTSTDQFNVRVRGGARFVTSGAGLTVDGQNVLTGASSLNATQLSGTIQNTSLPASPTFGGTVTAGALSGNGVGVTNVNAATLNGLNSGAFWQTGGNNITSSQFFGSTNNEPLRIRVNNQRSLIILTNPADSASLIAGSPANLIDAGIEGATIAGGGTTNFLGAPSANRISADFSSISGGSGNWIQPQSDHSVIAGGWNNLISTDNWESVIVGGSANAIYSPSAGAAQVSVIGGGNANTNQGTYCVLVGGENNTILFDVLGTAFSFIGGGYSNTLDGAGSVIGGGEQNKIEFGSYNCVIGGGLVNMITNSSYATVGGGHGNAAYASYSTVPGGNENIAGGQFSFAAGQQAQALHEGAFVWADSENSAFSSITNDQFLVRAHGGVGIDTDVTVESDLTINTSTYLDSHIMYLRGDQGPDHNHGLAYCGNGITNFAPGVLPDGPVLWGYSGGALGVVNGGSRAILTWTNGGVFINGGFSFLSDRAEKTNFDALNAQEILARVAALPITSWFYKTDTTDRHIGPMAQDFHAAFEVNGHDDTHINVGDETGVALAAIKGLNEKVQEQQERLKAKDARIEALEQRLDRLEKIVARSE